MLSIGLEIVAFNLVPAEIGWIDLIVLAILCALKSTWSAENCCYFMSKADSFGSKNALQKHPIIEKGGTVYIPFKE